MAETEKEEQQKGEREGIKREGEIDRDRQRQPETDRLLEIETDRQTN